MPERSIGLAWKACVGLNQPWVRIPPCPPFLRTGNPFCGTRELARSQGNGGPIPPCPFLLRKSKFTHAKDAKAGTGDTFYLPLSTWRPWREVLGFSHAKVAKGGKGILFYFPLSTWRPWREVLGFTPSKQTRRALLCVGPGCGERDNRVRLLPAIFFADDCRKAESGF